MPLPYVFSNDALWCLMMRKMVMVMVMMKAMNQKMKRMNCERLKKMRI